MSETGIAAGQTILAALKAGREVLAEYDLEVIGDMTEEDGSTEDAPKWKPVFYIGQKYEPSAGIIGFALGCQPLAAFDTANEALLWAGAHANDIRKEMGW